MRNLFLLKIFAFALVNLNASAQDLILAEKGIILAVEDDKVYLDLNENNTTIGSRYQVIKDRGHFIHPVTGEKISRDPEIVAYIEIIDVKSNYSIGSVSPRGALSFLEKGMEVFILEGVQRETREFRKSIAVQPMNVSSARGGYLGFYIADLLTEELFNIDKFRVIDRQTLGLQMDEIAMSSQGIIDEREAVRIGRTGGVDYFITGTVYEPDVVEISTGVPIKGILGAAEAISGQRLGADLVSDVRVSQLRAIVNITLRVVDVQTGEILFIASEMQQAQGRSQINLEQGALGGLQLQGGATSFLNTITGQATKTALVNLAKYIDNFFEGEINERNFKGNVIEIGKVGTRSERLEIKNANIIHSEASGYDWLKRQTFKIDIDKGTKTDYRKNFSYPVYQDLYVDSKISGEKIKKGSKKIGMVKLNETEDEVSQGNLKLSMNLNKPENYSFSNYEVRFIRHRSFNLNISHGFGKGVGDIGYVKISSVYLLNNNIGFGLDVFYDSYRNVRKNVSINDTINYMVNSHREFYSFSYFLNGGLRLNRIFGCYLKMGIIDGYIRKYDTETNQYLQASDEYFILLEPSLNIFIVNWLSFNTVFSVLPYRAVSIGIGFHFF